MITIPTIIYFILFIKKYGKTTMERIEIFCIGWIAVMALGVLEYTFWRLVLQF
jgi:hypothetical protein